MYYLSFYTKDNKLIIEKSLFQQEYSLFITSLLLDNLKYKKIITNQSFDHYYIRLYYSKYFRVIKNVDDSFVSLDTTKPFIDIFLDENDDEDKKEITFSNNEEVILVMKDIHTFIDRINHL
jgi:hypothetical protein